MWHIWGEKCVQSFGWKTCRDLLEDIGVDGMIKLKCFYMNSWKGMDSSGSAKGLVVGSSKCGTETSGSIKQKNFLTS
jgi:hypothetical protein